MNLLINKPKPDINFYNTGMIEVNRNISKQLELKDGDYINFAENEGEYMLFKSTYGIRMRKTNRTRKHYGFMRGSNSSICKTILKEKRMAKYRIGDSDVLDGKKVLYIITCINYATERD